MPVIRIFKAFTEDWEKPLCHSYNPLAQFKLFAKYQNMKYVYPGKKKAIPFYVCNDSLIWYDQKKGSHKDYGWAVILIPKGQTFDPRKKDEYAHELIMQYGNCENNLQFFISLSSQSDNVLVHDKNADKISGEEAYVNRFGFSPKMSINYFDLTDESEINPRGNDKE